MEGSILKTFLNETADLSAQERAKKLEQNKVTFHIYDLFHFEMVNQIITLLTCPNHLYRQYVQHMMLLQKKESAG